MTARSPEITLRGLRHGQPPEARSPPRAGRGNGRRLARTSPRRAESSTTDPRPAPRSTWPTCGAHGPRDTVVAVPEVPRCRGAPLARVHRARPLARRHRHRRRARRRRRRDDDERRAPSAASTLTPDDEAPSTPTRPPSPTFDGEEVALASACGARPTVVNFFASTCVPCITEMPAFEEVHQELGRRRSPSSASPWPTGRRRPGPRRADRGHLPHRPGPRRLGHHRPRRHASCPTTVLLDADGEIVATHDGELDADELRDAARRRARHRPVIDAPLALAFGAGMLATVNPCGFAMLPAYLGFFLGLGGRRTATSGPACSRSLGVGAVGVGRVPRRVQRSSGWRSTTCPASVDRWTPWATIVIGVVLVVLGIADAPRATSRCSTLPKLERGGRTPRPAGRCSCSACPTPSRRSRARCRCSRARWPARSAATNLVSSLAVFVAYSLGMTLVLLRADRQPRHGPPGPACAGCAGPCPTSPARRACCSWSPAPTSRTTAGTSGGCERGDAGDGSRRRRPGHRLVRATSAEWVNDVGATRLGLLLALGARRRAHRHLRPPGPRR